MIDTISISGYLLEVQTDDYWTSDTGKIVVEMEVKVSNSLVYSGTEINGV